MVGNPEDFVQLVGDVDDVGAVGLQVFDHFEQAVRSGSRPRKMFSATLISSTGESSWWIIEMPSSRAFDGDSMVTWSRPRELYQAES